MTGAQSDLKKLKGEVQNALKQEDWNKGIVLLKEWCVQKPDDSRGWYYLGYFLTKLNRFEDAEAFVKKSLSLDPDNKSAVTLLNFIKKQAAMRKEQDELSPHRVWRQGGVVDGRYVVRGSKKGGMGEVYFAFDRELDHMVAIKAPLLSVLEKDKQRARFYREAEAWIGLGMHPNICSAYYVQEFGGIPWLFIEYIGGGTLQDLLKKKQLTQKQKIDIALQLASGMNHTHSITWRDEDGKKQSGLVHRDLKPANILMDRFGTARITDFGLVGLAGEDSAKQNIDMDSIQTNQLASNEDDSSPGGVDWEIAADVHWQTITVAGAAVGTPPYMAPEQWKASHLVSFPADIYAYGVILFSIFCGRKPFELDEKYRHAMAAHKIYQWEKLHTEETPPDPRSLNPDINGRLADIILQCLEKNPSARPTSFQVIRDALKIAYEESTGESYPRPEPRASRLLADSLNNQGVSFITIGQARRAENAWKEALKTDPHHIEATFNLALHEWKEKTIGKEEVYRRMEETGRSHASFWRHQHLSGRLNLFFGDNVRAVGYLEEAVKSGDAQVNVLKDLGLAMCAEAGTSDKELIWQSVAACFKKVIDAGYEDPPTATGYALALKKLNKPDESRLFFNQAVRRHFDMPFSLDEAIHAYLPGQEIIASIKHTGWVNYLGFMTGQNRAICGGEDKISFWDIRLTPSAKAARNVSSDNKGSESDPAVSRLWNVLPSRTFKTFPLKSGAVSSMALSPDGRYAATGGAQGVIQLWNIEEERKIRDYIGHERAVTALSFSHDGQYLLSGGKDMIARLWETETGVCFETLKGHSDLICHTDFCLDPKYVLTVSHDSTILIWDSYDGTLEKAMEGHTDKIAGAAIAPDRTLLATAGFDKTIRIWDLRHGRLKHLIEGHSARVSSVSFSPDGRYLLSAAHDKTLKLWAADTGKLERTFRFPQRLENAVISPDAQLVLASMADPESPNLKSIVLMEFQTQERYKVPYIVTVPLSASKADEREIEFQKLLEAGRNQLAEEKYAHAFTTLKKARSISGYERDADALAMWSKLSSIYPSRILRTAWEKEILTGHEADITTSAVSPDGRFLLTGSTDHTLRLWDLYQNRLMHVMRGHEGPVTSVSLFGGGRFAVSGSMDKSFRIWDLDEGACIRVLVEQESEITAAATGPDGRYGVYASADETLQLWNLMSQVPVRSFEGYTGYITSIDFTPDGVYAVTSGSDRTIRIWEIYSGDCVRIIRGHPGKVNDAKVSPDGQYILSACDDGVLRKWHIEIEELPETFGGHNGPVNCVAWAADGKFAYSGGSDRTIRVWDLTTGKNISVIEGHKSGVTSLKTVLNRQMLISTGADKTIRIWSMDWEPEIIAAGPWHEDIRAYLDVFLTLHTPYLAGSQQRRGKPEWDADEFQALLDVLKQRGYGWVEPRGIKVQLKEMARRRHHPLESLSIFFREVFNGVKMVFMPLRFLKKPIIFIYKLLPAALMAILLYQNDMFGLHIALVALIIVFLIVVMFAKKR